MKRFFGALMVILLVVFFSSCQREIDWELENQLESDSTLLNKLVLLDTTLSAPFDSIEYLIAKYDLKKRPIEVQYLIRNGLILDTGYIINNYFSGNDTMPYKAIVTDHQMDVSTTSFLIYNSSGKLIADSSIERFFGDSAIITNKYIYQSSRLCVEYNYRNSNGLSSSGTNCFYQTFTGSNLLEQKDTSDLTGIGYAISLLYQFNNTLNPLRKLGFGQNLYYHGEETLIENTSKYNFLDIYTKREELNPPSIIDIDHYRYSYQYNNYGLPTVAWEREVDNGTVDKYVFFYTK